MAQDRTTYLITSHTTMVASAGRKRNRRDDKVQKTDYLIAKYIKKQAKLKAVNKERRKAINRENAAAQMAREKAAKMAEEAAAAVFGVDLRSNEKTNRMLTRDMKSHQSKRNEQQQQAGYTTTAEYRSSGNNFTRQMGANMDAIFENNNTNQRSLHSEPEKCYDGGSKKDDGEDMMETIKSCYEPPSREKRGYGRSNVNHGELEEQSSDYERHAMVNSFGFTKVNDREPKESKNSDDKEKKVDSGATQDGMMQATPQPSTTRNDGWLDRLSPSKYLEGTPLLYLLLS
jgi:hypothetical protein